MTVKRRLAVAHTYGEGNVVSDCSSRGKLGELGRYCSQVGVKSRQLDITGEVWNLIQEVKDALENPRGGIDRQLIRDVYRVVAPRFSGAPTAEGW